MTGGKTGAVPGLLAELEGLLEKKLAPAVVTTDYPFQQRKLPPDRPVVWLGVEKISAAGSCFSPWMGEEENGAGGSALLGREVELTVRVEILDRYDGGACHRIFGELCQILLLEEGRPRVRELSCGGAAFDREAGAFRLVCKGSLRAVLTRSEEERRLADIVVKKEEGMP